MQAIRDFYKAFGYLKNYLGKYKKNRFISRIFTTLETIFELLIPMLVGKILNTAVYNKDLGLAIKYGLLMIFIALITMYCGMQATKNAGLTGSGIAANTREAEFRKIQTFAFEDLEYFGVPSLMTRITSDMQMLAQSTFMSTRFVIKTLVMAIFSFVLAFRASAKLSLIFLIGVPLLFAVLMTITTFAIPKFRKARVQYDRQNLVIEENLRNMRVIKAFVRKHYEMDKFEVENDGLYRLDDGSNGDMSFIFPISNIILFTTFVAITYFGGVEIIEGRLGVGDLISFNMYATMLLGAFIGLNMVLTTFMSASPGVSRVVEVLTRKISLDNDDKIEGLDLEDGSIDFDKVSFKYEQDSDDYQLEDIDLHIKSGESIGILGPTGSSKSTLVQLIPRLYDISKGTLKVGGHEVKSYDLKTLRDRVSIVLQKNTLFSGSIAENLRWGDEGASDEEVKLASQIAQAHDFVSQRYEGYNSVLGQGGSGVSGGQRQRLTIARSLLKKPKILILDNSTSAVDTKTESAIIDGINKYSKDLTKIIISQRISSFKYVDRIIVMDEGRIADIGSHEELYQRNKIYRQTYDIQAQGGDDNE
ncbi:MAG: ABC transporter ATP-binding protein [Anaerococcus sp.]|nr:ABC transporter ATP-binding protein/permease [Anaerococcus sp.]MDD7045370.1 ABC transporter ATP-binding protein [Peptoniphilaceae bacterium]MDY2919600.1 ABC transporter ATP-binding protein [Anaerococcus sp.]